MTSIWCIGHIIRYRETEKSDLIYYYTTSYHLKLGWSVTKLVVL